MTLSNNICRVRAFCQGEAPFVVAERVVARMRNAGASAGCCPENAGSSFGTDSGRLLFKITPPPGIVSRVFDITAMSVSHVRRYHVSPFKGDVMKGNECLVVGKKERERDGEICILRGDATRVNYLSPKQPGCAWCLIKD